MPRNPEIIVDIDTDGSVQVEVNGVVGKGCEALTKPLEDALGKPATKRLKPEYRQNAGQRATH